MGEEVTKTKLNICFHCGNKTPMEIVATYTWGSDMSDEFQFGYSYELLKCPVCNRPTLFEEYGDEEMCWGDDVERRVRSLYPSSSIDENAVPAQIAKTYEKALQMKGSDCALCAMVLGQTLEMILEDKKAKGNNLKEKIEDMANQGIFPESLKEASDISRLLRNKATHRDPASLDQFDIEYSVGFIGHIIEYLYILPYKLDEFKQWSEAKKIREANAPSNSNLNNQDF